MDVAGSLDVIWRRDLHQCLSASLMAAGSGALIVAGKWSRLFRLDPATGETLWEVSIKTANGICAVSGDACIYVDRRETMTCFDLATGAVRWSTKDEYMNEYLCVAGVSVLTGGYHPLHARNIATDEMLWSYGSQEYSGYAEKFCRPLAHSNGVLITHAGVTSFVTSTRVLVPKCSGGSCLNW